MRGALLEIFYPYRLTAFSQLDEVSTVINTVILEEIR